MVVIFPDHTHLLFLPLFQLNVCELYSDETVRTHRQVILLLINIENSPVYEAFPIVMKVHFCADFYRTEWIDSMKTNK